MKIIPAFVIAAAAAVSMYAQAATSADMYGTPAKGAIPQRTITIDGSTRFVNVHQSDTITFVDGKDSTTWFFDGIADSFPLSKILPDAAGAENVKVYVQYQRD